MIALAAFVIGVLGVLLDAYVGQTIWRWYFQPLGLPALGYLQTLGMMVAIRYFATGLDTYYVFRDSDVGDSLKLAVVAIIRAAIALLIAWLCLP